MACPLRGLDRSSQKPLHPEGALGSTWEAQCHLIESTQLPLRPLLNYSERQSRQVAVALLVVQSLPNFNRSSIVKPVWSIGAYLVRLNGGKKTGKVRIRLGAASSGFQALSSSSGQYRRVLVFAIRMSEPSTGLLRSDVIRTTPDVIVIAVARQAQNSRVTVRSRGPSRDLRVMNRHQVRRKDEELPMGTVTSVRVACHISAAIWLAQLAECAGQSAAR